MKQNVIIIGASGHAKVIIDIFEKQQAYQILGLLEDGTRKNEQLLGYSILGALNDLPEILSKNTNCKLFIAIGDNWMRHKIKGKITTIAPDVDFVNAIHPNAQLGKNVTLGIGISIMPGAIINSNSHLGDFTIVNTGASLDHDSVMEDFSSLAPNATTGGNVTIGTFSVISISATLKHGITIGKHAIIGAGALLLKNCDDYQIMFGIPAKVIRRRQLGDKYL